MAVEIQTSFEQICDASGNPLSGAKIYVYDMGSTTPKTLYSAYDLSGAAAANPIICDSAGRHDMRYMATGSYKIVVKTSADVTLYTRDNIDGRVPVGSGVLGIANGGTGSGTAPGAIAALGGATVAEVAALSTTVAGLVGATASTEATHIATGTTAQRAASPIAGDVRRNTTTNRYEGYNQSTAFEQFLTDTEIASSAEAVAGTDNTKVMTPSKVRAASAFHSIYMHCRDEKVANTDGGTLTSGSFVKRSIGTSTAVVNNIASASLASDVITLPAGTYYVEGSAPAMNVDGHVTKLRNTTDSTDTIIGTAEKSVAAGNVVTRSYIEGWFTIAAQKTFEFQHRGATTRATDGLGKAANLGVAEVYAKISIWKIA